MYFLAGHGHGDVKAAADAGSVGKSTVRKYLDEFCDGVFKVLRPIYMPSTPPSPEIIQQIRSHRSY